MVSLVVMFVAGMAIGHGNPLKDDVGRDAGQFSVDQRGKFVVHDSETLPSGVSFSDIQAQLNTFLASKGDDTELKGTTRLESRGRVPMKKHAGIGNYVAGDVHYTFVMEDKGGELTYWFTDLTYQPFRNDRYGKRVKATASPIPLEKQMSKVNTQVWKKQKNYAYEAINEMADQVLAQLETARKPRVITTGME